MPSLQLACPECRAPVSITNDTARCSRCGTEYEQSGGIWKFLTAARAAQYEKFLQEYHLLRAAEGWGSSDSAYYRSLPHVPRSDSQYPIWRIVAKNFPRLLDLVANAKPTFILDVGAGNGWLSYQLTRRGYHVAAVDISTDARDGLGAASNFEVSFERYQAEFDRLPFDDAQFDLVLFSASFHYSHDLAKTLLEAARVLRPTGKIIIAATPLYRSPVSGAIPAVEREQKFKRLFGVAQDSRVTGFLTEAQLGQLADEAGLDVHISHADSHWLKQLRRNWIQRRTGREPARFPLVVLQRRHALKIIEDELH